VQVRTLLNAVREGPCGERLVAYFACLYFAGLWIVAGVDPATAARWAGQSIEILFRIYAAWLSDSHQALRKNIEDAYSS
jgi:hypothetical protein